MTYTPAHVMRMPSGDSDFGVDAPYLAARCKRDAYLAPSAFSRRSSSTPQCTQSVIRDRLAGPYVVGGTWTGFESGLSL